MWEQGIEGHWEMKDEPVHHDRQIQGALGQCWMVREVPFPGLCFGG